MKKRVLLVGCRFGKFTSLIDQLSRSLVTLYLTVFSDIERKQPYSEHNIKGCLIQCKTAHITTLIKPFYLIQSVI